MKRVGVDLGEDSDILDRPENGEINYTASIGLWPGYKPSAYAIHISVYGVILHCKHSFLYFFLGVLMENIYQQKFKMSLLPENQLSLQTVLLLLVKEFAGDDVAYDTPVDKRTY